VRTNNLPRNGFIPVSFMVAMVLFVLDAEGLALLVANGSGAVCRPKLAVVLIFARFHLIHLISSAVALQAAADSDLRGFLGPGQRQWPALAFVVCISAMAPMKLPAILPFFITTQLWRGITKVGVVDGHSERLSVAALHRGCEICHKNSAKRRSSYPVSCDALIPPYSVHFFPPSKKRNTAAQW
jgi:hypothetical protein